MCIRDRRIRTKKGLRTRQTTTEPTTLQTTTEPTTLQTTDPAGLVCDRCKLQRPAYYYDPWTFYNRNRNQTQCCNACKPLKHCTPCGQWKPCTAFRRGAQFCKDCQLVPCAICQQTLPTHHSVPSDVRHHFSQQRAIVCSPCKTKGAKVRSGPPKPRDSPGTDGQKYCPRCGTYDDLRNFTRTHRKGETAICRSCYFSSSPAKQFCTTCGLKQEIREFRRSQGQRHKVCRTCERIRCSACHRNLPHRSFNLKDIAHHFSHDRQIVCLQCKGHGSTARQPRPPILCSGPCGRLQKRKKGHNPFRARLTKKQQPPDNLLCNTCRKSTQRNRRQQGRTTKEIETTERDRRRHLEHLMKTSRRSACTCQRPLAHADACPMHMRFFGEQPYPGCDVMTREDSDWLLSQRHPRKRKHGLEDAD